MKKVLFICLGNICRSPAAEGVFAHLVKEAGLLDYFEIDSAGTSAAHEGELADERMRGHARARGIELTSISRQYLGEKDLEYFDHILVMDKSNYKGVISRDSQGQYLNKVEMFTDYLQHLNFSEVPDPYYGGAEGFERVLDIVTDASQGLLEKLKKEL